MTAYLDYTLKGLDFNQPESLLAPDLCMAELYRGPE